MKWTAKGRVMGMGLFDNTIDGQVVKSGMVFIEESMAAETRGGSCWGNRGVAMVADVDFVRENGIRFADVLPCEFDVTYEMEVGRKRESVKVIGLNLIRVGQPAKAA